MSQLKLGAVLSYLNIILTNIIGLFLTPFIVRSLGNSEYGLYTLIGAFVGYIAVMDLGLNNTIVRYVSKYRALKDKNAEENFLGTALFIYSVISVIVIIIGTFFYYNLENVFKFSLSHDDIAKAKIMMLILIFNLAISLPGGAFTAISNAYEKFVFPRALANIKYIIRAILILLILRLGANSIGLVILDTIINLISITATFVYVKKYIKVKFNFKIPEKSILVDIFSYSIWIFIFSIVGQLQWQGGQFVIGKNLGTNAVAIYAIGILLGSYYGAFSGAISNLFLPRATQMVVKESSSKDLTIMMLRVARYSLLSLIPIFIGFLMFGKSFIFLWIGQEYYNAYYIALIVMIGYTIPLTQTFANSLLEAKKLFKFKAFVYFVSLSFGTIVSFFISNKYGIISVALSIVIAWIFSQIIMNVFYQKVLKLDVLYFFKHLILLFTPTILITFCCFFLVNKYPLENWLGLFVKASISMLCYLIIVYCLVLTKDEKSTIHNLIKKLKWS